MCVDVFQNAWSLVACTMLLKARIFRCHSHLATHDESLCLKIFCPQSLWGGSVSLKNWPSELTVLWPVCKVLNPNFFTFLFLFVHNKRGHMQRSSSALKKQYCLELVWIFFLKFNLSQESHQMIITAGYHPKCVFLDFPFLNFFFLNIANKPVCVMSFVSFLMVSLFGYIIWLYWPVKQSKWQLVVKPEVSRYWTDIWLTVFFQRSINLLWGTWGTTLRRTFEI